MRRAKETPINLVPENLEHKVFVLEKALSETREGGSETKSGGGATASKIDEIARPFRTSLTSEHLKPIHPAMQHAIELLEIGLDNLKINRKVIDDQITRLHNEMTEATGHILAVEAALQTLRYAVAARLNTLKEVTASPDTLSGDSPH